ncbi:acyltransferase family protein [Actinophytocola gossypii]|uniref:Acyltransferase n=1 Tax=Actinophytocola gossypii TaxID=2812003 RepID=A0ABT2J928_9PSEU|nr:acyltransferase family protein [Actinophytocola gossypii]MCT2584363.1 acyltransferase [Actinophytocola gossypii]
MGVAVEERHEPAPSRNTERPARGFRPDIQALRAVAVLAVVLNHLWPEWLTGGYVGVDVFFVISGFLISSHLGREIGTTGRVRLGRFYARRVRRLLPAAFLVLGASLVAAYLLLPYPRWEANAQEAVASALYFENWLLAINSVDYSAVNAVASLVQHYWSLSVEEQFYLFWPLLLVLLFKLRARLAGIAVVGAASLAYSVYLTETSPEQAYFVTPVRVWEFALGALVALLGTRLVLPRAACGIASLAGFAMIVGSAVAYGHGTPFPGYLALVPTVGTALVIVAGNRDGRQWHTPVTSSAPVQFVGNVSYSLYLWHWPLIVLAPFALGVTEPTTLQLLGVLAASLVLAYLSKVLVEDRGMAWPRLTRSTGLTFTGMVAGVVAVSLAAGSLNWTYDRHVAQAERELAVQAADRCHGAGALDQENDCADPLGPAEVVTMGPANRYYWAPPECVPVDEYRAGDKQTTSVCDYSRGASSAETVWLVGDSHAQQWQSPLFELAEERGWVLKFAVLGGCPFAKIQFTGYRVEAPEAHTQTCMDWTERMVDVIAADRPAMVLTSFHAREENADDGSGRSQVEQYREGLEPYWRVWTDAGARVVVLADPPQSVSVRSRDCVTLNPDDPLACAADRAAAHPPDPLTEVARTTDEVTLVDLTDYFCDARRCYAVVGNVAVYFDGDHLNREFSQSLKPMLAEALDAVR